MMKLCGEGFMIANRKNDDGSWDWRAFGTGEGFTADLIVTGFLSADCIQAHSITANHLAADGPIAGFIQQHVDQDDGGERRHFGGGLPGGIAGRPRGCAL